MSAAKAVPCIGRHNGRVAASRGKIRRSAEIQSATSDTDLRQSNRLDDPVAEAILGGVEVRIGRVGAGQAIESEACFIQAVIGESVRFVQRKKLPARLKSVPKAGDRVSREIGLDAGGEIEAVIAVQLV